MNNKEGTKEKILKKNEKRLKVLEILTYVFLVIVFLLIIFILTLN